ncbi:MAG: hypothetical protein P1Q69_13885 [Candidatus Thorarchaeota archaeon]|nr:hypothetical protein [Candidatus Thorarchaeota archaeon]
MQRQWLGSKRDIARGSVGESGIDFSNGIAVENGYAYITGQTFTSDFPISNAYDPNPEGNSDCFVVKFSTDGGSLVYSTFLGGSDEESDAGITVEDGHAYIVGYTESSDFPLVNAYDSVNQDLHDGFVTKFALDGRSLEYSTLLGGDSEEYMWDIVTVNGYAYITGETQSTNYPTTSDLDYKSDFNDAVVTMLSKHGSTLVYSMVLGGESTESGYAIDVSNGTTYVTGYTYSEDIPTLAALDSSYNDGDDSFILLIGLDSDEDGLCDF